MRAQIWSFDAVTSITVFLVGFAILLLSWSVLQARVTEQNQAVALEARAYGITEGLLRTAGLPPDWNAGNVLSVGITQQENVINQTLLLRFLALPEATAAARFGIAGANYQFRILDLNNSVRQVGGAPAESGTAPAANATFVAPITRFALLDGDPVTLELFLWLS